MLSVVDPPLHHYPYALWSLLSKIKVTGTQTAIPQQFISWLLTEQWVSSMWSLNNTDKGMIHGSGGMEQEGVRLHHITQKGTQFQT